MRKVSLCIIIIALAIMLGIVIGRHSNHSASTAKTPLYWVDSMEPEVHYPAPGKSHMGMELVPVYTEKEQPADESTIRISPTLVNNLGVRIVPVVQGTLAKSISAVGYVEPNENKISHIHSYTEGWVRKLLVKAVGDPVRKDQELLQLYSPILINAQQEYLLALRNGDPSLADSAIQKLQALHVPEQQIQQLKITRKPSQLISVNSPQDGIIAGLNIREGMHVTPETEMMSIVDLTSIWMIAEIFEEQANLVKVGESASAKLAAFPEKIWKGEVEYIYSQLDPTKRTLRVRFKFTNPDGFLKPNMYANIILFSEPKTNVLSIPIEALIRSSEGDRVIVSLGDGRFQARAVTVGIESNDKVEILTGLKVGENVVTSGQFLIDSETNLKTGLQRLDASKTVQDTQSQSSESVPLIEGKGIITGLNASTHTLTLQHEPIPALNWPVMTMDFTVDKNISLDDFKVGDQVQFVLKNAKENQTITEMKKIPK